MTLSRSARRLLAGIAGGFLLLCQTAMAVQACGLAPAAAGEVAAGEPCHGADPQSGDAPGHALQQSCSSGFTSAGFAKLDVPQVADLPMLVLHPASLPAPAHGEVIAVAIPARAESPPLPILHCCLRN